MMKYDNRMICEYCEIDKKSQKRPITPSLSPRPDKQVKSINEVIEELPPPEDPMEDIKLNDEPTSSTIPTYAQIVKENQNTSEIQIPPKSHLKCLNCGRNTKNNHRKSQMTKVIVDEFTLLCKKCTTLKENQERYGSSRSIKQCKVCKIHTDYYKSRAGGNIVCRSL